MYGIDRQIKEKFRLFSGLRDEREDRKILERVKLAVSAELMIFLEENLSQDFFREMNKKLTSVREALGAVKIFERYFEHVSDGNRRWETRQKDFLNNLVYDTLYE